MTDSDTLSHGPEKITAVKSFTVQGTGVTARKLFTVSMMVLLNKLECFILAIFQAIESNASTLE